jgi:hypothetical protein
VVDGSDDMRGDNAFRYMGSRIASRQDSYFLASTKVVMSEYHVRVPLG